MGKKRVHDQIMAKMGRIGEDWGDGGLGGGDKGLGEVKLEIKGVVWLVVGDIGWRQGV